MRVTLAPLGPEDFPRLAHIRVAPDQEVYSGTVAAAFAEDPARFNLHAIAVDGKPVGLFKIDRDYHASISLAEPGELGLRAFMIDRDQQGRGIATAAVRALGPYLRRHYPDAPSVALTVNHVNAAALACYLNGGFADTGVDWPHGRAGPQDFLRLSLATPAPAGARTGRSLRMGLRRVLVTVRRKVPPGLRLCLGLLLIVGGVFGFLPVLGFWMIPLGLAVAALDILPIWRALSGQERNGPPRD